MSNNTVLFAEVPRQILSDEEAAAIESSAATSEIASSLAMGGNFVLNLFFAFSLNHLWSMLNGL